jgi:multidrug efflux pump subunit AcrA (membrane-fusion protein)
MKRSALVFLVAGALTASLAVWGGLEWRKSGARPAAMTLPCTTVKRGEVRVAVTARGELQGGNSEMLGAPMIGARELVITYLRQPGELVDAGDVVAEFDTTEQEFALQEAEADLAEAEQQVLQAQAETQAKEEETRAQHRQAEADVRLAELEARKNPLVAAIVARQNTLGVEAARDRLRQLEHDLANRKATSQAAVMIQEAARSKAKLKAATARRNIDSMKLKAKSAGYVNIQQNTSGNFMFWGMQLPVFQVGDIARPGMAVAQIPDLKNWEVSARIAELDRGHLAAGQPAEVVIVALPGKRFTAQVKNIGGTSGPPWDRNFECRLTVQDPSPELRPGMSARIVITTQVLPNVLWVPSQALFESDGRAFVYLRSGASFTPADVKLVRRSESQVVLTGLKEGQVVAMANPAETSQKKDAGGGALKALPKS